MNSYFDYVHPQELVKFITVMVYAYYLSSKLIKQFSLQDLEITTIAQLLLEIVCSIIRWHQQEMSHT